MYLIVFHVANNKVIVIVLNSFITHKLKGAKIVHKVSKKKYAFVHDFANSIPCNENYKLLNSSCRHFANTLTWFLYYHIELCNNGYDIVRRKNLLLLFNHS